jgi:2-dehydro-3-deoxyphosphooctonate aldolase (KDO 8-P synthase)
MSQLYDNLISGSAPFFIVGPCVMESEGLLEEVAEELARLKKVYKVEIIFKSSFDKANRTSASSFRGPGITTGMDWLRTIKKSFNLSVTTDIHEPWQADQVAEVVDIIQIPAFLCRQTDLLEAAANTGKIVNIKKAQFLAGDDMRYPLEKVTEVGNESVLLTERGTMFGYNNLIVDFRNIPIMKRLGKPVVMDCTHSVQRPGGLAGKTGGDREYVPAMAKAAKAFGADGYFLETHPHPADALSDGPNMIRLDQLEAVIASLTS